MSAIVIDLFRKKEIECFQNIKELPIGKWFDVYESGDYKHLQKDAKIIANRFQLEKLTEAWQNIQNSFIDEFSIPDSLLDIMNCKRKIAILENKIILTGDLSLRTLISILQLELKKLIGSETAPQKFGEIIAFVNKNSNYRVDTKIVTVYEFYYAIKGIQDELKSTSKTS